MHEYFLLDIDGVFFRDSEVIPSSKSALIELINKSKSFFFVTNNSCYTAEDLASRLNRKILLNEKEKVLPKQCLTPVELIPFTLGKRFPKVKKILCFGEESL